MRSFAYLIGSIPVAYIFGRVLKGLDIREHGSGNMGATNAFRVLGKGPGTMVLILDILKGIIPVTLLANVFGLRDALSLVIISVAAVAGHNWTVFLGFKGGKGMATSLGILDRPGHSIAGFTDRFGAGDLDLAGAFYFLRVCFPGVHQCCALLYTHFDGHL